MISINKKSNIIYLENQIGLCLDTTLKSTKISKNDTTISSVKINELSKYQIIVKKSQSPQVSNIKDYLYARCIQEGFFAIQNHYTFTYTLEDRVSEYIYHIYAKELTQPLQNHPQPTFLIPDIFLPFALEDRYRESNLFLFDESLVFYHQGNLAYQTSVLDTPSLSRALHYIQTIYSKLPSSLYCDNEKFLKIDVGIPVQPLSDLIDSTYPIARLCFDYIQKCSNEDLPLLSNAHKPHTKSKTLSMLSKIAVVIILMLIFPIGKMGYGFYVDHQTQMLQSQNNKVLEAINSSNQNHSKVFQNTKVKSQFLQHHLHSLAKIQTSYTPRYNIIAEISRRLEGRGISVENFYFTSDIAENVEVLELEITSNSEKSLVEFMQNLSNIPISSTIPNSLVKNEKIFSNGIFKENQALMTKIVWISNAL